MTSDPMTCARAARAAATTTTTTAAQVTRARAWRGTAIAAIVAALAGGCAKNIPVPAVTISTDEATVARGKYLVEHAMVCVACHSPRDWSKLGGPPVEGKELAGHALTSKDDGFPPSFEFGAPNLTPQHLGAWSDGEIVRATVLGQNRDKEGLFPLMPYRVWRDHVALDDAAAMVAYLRTLPAKPGDAMPARKFPMPGFVLNGFPEPRELRATAPKPGDADYGKYVTMRSACIECHTNVDNRGTPIGAPFSGGRVFPVAAPGKGKVTSSNITPDKETGIGAWTKEQFVARFKTASLEAARATPLDDTGFNTVMPWWSYAGLSDEDLGAMFDFLMAQPPVPYKVVRHAP